MSRNLIENKQENEQNIPFKRSYKKKRTYRELKPKIALDTINEFKGREEEIPDQSKRRASNAIVFHHVEEKIKPNGYERITTTTTIVNPSNERTMRPFTNRSNLPASRSVNVSLRDKQNNNKYLKANSSNITYTINDQRISSAFKKSVSNNFINNNRRERSTSFHEELRVNNNLMKINNRRERSTSFHEEPRVNNNLMKINNKRERTTSFNQEPRINNNLMKINNRREKTTNEESKANNTSIKITNKRERRTSFNEESKINNTFNKINNKKERKTSFNIEPKINNNLVKTNNNKKIEINLKKKDDKKKIQNVTKYERIIDNRSNINNKVKEEEEDDDWDIEELKGYQKKTVDVMKMRQKYAKNPKDKNNPINKINTEFSKLEYVKISKATTVAGKSEDGLKKINQDTFICERNINGVLNFNMFGVLDGHGVNGHLVSHFVSKFIINRIKNITSIKKLDSPEAIYQLLKSNGYQIIATAFMDADVQVAKEKFDCLRSGTTCVIVFQCDEHIICANAGDSRAIMIFDDSNNDSLKDTKIYPLSYDCKPEIPMERKRIMANGGSVEQFIDDNDQGVGPFRVFIKDQENPGLAMSRSIGDIEAKTVGVIPNPQIIEYEINRKSKYMIICSDGIWEFISNEEAMEIGKKYYLRHDPLGLCNELTNKATEIWKVEDIVIDDITVVVVFF
jgi:serine/threonine protein phosphatase PrpC